jgi:hypothetical protein
MVRNRKYAGVLLIVFGIVSLFLSSAFRHAYFVPALSFGFVLIACGMISLTHSDHTI